MVVASLETLLMVWAVVIGPFAWLLRDGLGPGATDSGGWQSVGRFLMTFYWGPILLALAGLRFLAGRRLPGG
ncbi:hypothetical protein [Aquisphaera giovannonii]|nr:hypothetical protein [Aquisphaera giovannonii]